MNKLKELREAHCFTQEQCAKIAFISKKTYIRYETGERIMPMDTAIYYARFYKVSLDYIAGLDGEENFKKGKSEIRQEMMSKEIIPQLLAAVSRLSHKQQMALMEFLNSN